jgi:hypothetical protein
MDDYAFARDTTMTSGVHSILGNSSASISLGTVTNADGSANTLLLSHKAMSPTNYSASASVNDNTWANLDNGAASSDHQRDATTGPAMDTTSISANVFGSPHPNAMPSLFADGTVRSYSYGYISAPGTTAIDTWQYMWGWDDAKTVTPP